MTNEQLLVRVEKAVNESAHSVRMLALSVLERTERDPRETEAYLASCASAERAREAEREWRVEYAARLEQCNAATERQAAALERIADLLAVLAGPKT